MFVLGGPGSGKGTQCALLSREFGFVHVSVGDVLRREAASGSAQGCTLGALLADGLIVPMVCTFRNTHHASKAPIPNQ